MCNLKISERVPRHIEVNESGPVIDTGHCRETLNLIVGLEHENQTTDAETMWEATAANPDQTIFGDGVEVHWDAVERRWSEGDEEVR
ncbi:hypothetical protein [Streptomyces xinghaiensis]|uniref:hypothetical protein n=1 Tax=Streptomyces xinghaiensis TaxID=1038928 RepID=UPI0012FF888E|nr:hypothetical protein [Streptomyces xinghaiensis]MZE80854.1 hypothetical protein [Streptomyces sp. SID5475]